ncbi:MAG TPA: UDP-N-acetylmuramoyl-L-alanine--D-glutamate ligase [Acidimicrobiales bacterium]|nr:UDP-N-acetylmuramoyl-L-alanine--D-glutamate ligase [Acidimicrobiales bacterium]
MTARPAPARHRLGWGDLRGSRVGVWGLGVEGQANLRRLRALGVDPVLVDDRGTDGGGDGQEVLATGQGGLEGLAGCEVVVKTPGISRYRPEVAQLESAGVPVVGGLGLWMEEADRDRVACVTGTKGKSTTTAVAGHLLDRLGYRCVVGGNIGRPPWDPDGGGEAGTDYWVVEVSSFQATDLASSPPVVAVTSLSADHLDWHGDVDTYYRDKLSVCTRPGARVTVAAADPAVAGHRDQLGPEVRWVDTGDPEVDGPWAGTLGLLGRHNHRNALVARACLLALGVPEAADDAAMDRAAAGFQGLPSRLHLLGAVDGVTFVDDSLSTNVLPTLAALDAFEGRRVAVLVGGHDRGVDYGPLADGLAARAARAAATLVLTLPASGRRIHEAILRRLGDGAAPGTGSGGAGGDLLVVEDCDDLAAATRRGFEWAGPGGVVLLSPAAPSFGQFRDYADRAAAFADAMQTCGPVSTAAEGGAGD